MLHYINEKTGNVARYQAPKEKKANDLLTIYLGLEARAKEAIEMLMLKTVNNNFP